MRTILSSNITKNNDFLNDYESNMRLDIDKIMFKELKNKLDDYYAANNDLLKLVNENKYTDAEIMYNNMSSSASELLSYLNDYVNINIKWAVDANAQNNSIYKSSLSLILIIVGVALIFSIFGSYIFSTKSIVNPIKKLMELMVSAGHGDLTVRSNIKTGDELQVLGESFNKVLSEQEKIIKSIRNSSVELSSSSEELAASSQEVNAASEEIASNIQLVSEESGVQSNSVVNASQVLLQLSSLVQITQSKAVSANKNAKSTNNTANNGRMKVQDTVEEMNIINSCTNDTASVLRYVNDLSQKVEKIVITINSIAEQTNLLALNAAIEANSVDHFSRTFKKYFSKSPQQFSNGQ